MFAKLGAFSLAMLVLPLLTYFTFSAVITPGALHSRTLSTRSERRCAQSTVRATAVVFARCAAFLGKGHPYATVVRCVSAPT